VSYPRYAYINCKSFDAVWAINVPLGPLLKYNRGWKYRPRHFQLQRSPVCLRTGSRVTAGALFAANKNRFEICRIEFALNSANK
jgi:hypothetical protein